MSVREHYQERFTRVLSPLAGRLEAHVAECLGGEVRIDRVQARAKGIDRFVAKAEKHHGDTPKYNDPLHQIQDQIGVRIITFYLADVERVSAVIERYFRAVEAKSLVPESEWEFSYFGRHYVLLLPTDVVDPDWDRKLVPQFFELQIKTLFQHAWSEANHDLGYKAAAPLQADAKRRLAFTSAQAWGADRVFNELFQELGGTAGGEKK